VQDKEKSSKPQRKPFLRPSGISLNSSQTPASFKASSQASALSLVTIGKMGSGVTHGGAVRGLATQGAGVEEGAARSVLTSALTDIECDTNDSVAMGFVDPFAIVIEDQAFGIALMFFVTMSSGTEIALEGSGGWVRAKVCGLV